MKNFISLISALIIAVTIGIVAFIMGSKVNTFLKTQAITGCYSISRYEKTNATTGVTVSYPMPEIYKQCLKETGFSSK